MQKASVLPEFRLQPWDKSKVNDHLREALRANDFHVVPGGIEREFGLGAEHNEEELSEDARIERGGIVPISRQSLAAFARIPPFAFTPVRLSR